MADNIKPLAEMSRDELVTQYMNLYPDSQVSPEMTEEELRELLEGETLEEEAKNPADNPPEDEGTPADGTLATENIENAEEQLKAQNQPKDSKTPEATPEDNALAKILAKIEAVEEELKKEKKARVNAEKKVQALIANAQNGEKVVTPSPRAGIELMNDQKRTLEALRKEPKENIFYPKEEGDDPKHPYISVCINGVRIEIPKGKSVPVARSIYNMLTERLEADNKVFDEAPSNLEVLYRTTSGAEEALN